jgi:hypothetical protein
LNEFNKVISNKSIDPAALAEKVMGTRNAGSGQVGK